MKGGKMTGEHVNRGRCPLCGGTLAEGEATIPYVLQGNVVVVVKHVPALICADCHEAFTAGPVTDQIIDLLQQLKRLKSEVSVVSFGEYEAARQ